MKFVINYDATYKTMHDTLPIINNTLLVTAFCPSKVYTLFFGPSEYMREKGLMH